MPILTPTLNFAGRCEEALRLYEKAFKGKVSCLLRYKEGKKEDSHWQLTKEQENYIYHAELLIGSQRIMMCDNIDGRGAGAGTTASIPGPPPLLRMHSCTARVEIRCPVGNIRRGSVDGQS